MKVTYIAKFRIDMGKAIPAVDDLLSGVNTHLATMGCDERLKCYTSLPDLEMTVDRELTEEESYKMKVLLESQFVEHFGKYDVRLVEFGRKSVTSESSAS